MNNIEYIYDYQDFSKLKPNMLKDWQNESVDEYTYNNQTKKMSLDDAKKRIKSWKEHTKKNTGVIVIAKKDNKIIGVLSLFPKSERYKHLALFGITMSKESRGKGIGTKMIKKAIEITKNKLKDVKIIGLGVYDNNTKAIKLYEKLGFKKVATLPNILEWNPTGNKQEYRDEIIMHLYLDKNLEGYR